LAEHRFTLININDVEDVAAAASGPGPHQARLAKDDLGTDQFGVGHHRLAPGARQALGHRHAVAEEVYVVIAGSGRAKLDDELVELARLDTLRVSPQVFRNFEAGPEGMEFLAYGPRRDGDAEVIPGWWGT
jgi:mannose-6-phosphate isomerase-like protein (cupin superfamily)